MQSSSVRPACVLDTDVVIDFLRHQSYALTLIRELAQYGIATVSTLTHMEAFQGMRASEEQATRAFLDSLISVPVTVEIARAAGNLRAQMRKQGITVGVIDTIIGATAIHLDVPLVTNNVAHYPFLGLRVRKGR